MISFSIAVRRRGQIASIQCGTGRDQFSQNKREMDPDPDRDNGSVRGIFGDECRNVLRTLVIHVLRPPNSEILETWTVIWG
jgi:hypothetical protein